MPRPAFAGRDQGFDGLLAVQKLDQSYDRLPVLVKWQPAKPRVPDRLIAQTRKRTADIADGDVLNCHAFLGGRSAGTHMLGSLQCNKTRGDVLRVLLRSGKIEAAAGSLQSELHTHRTSARAIRYRFDAAGI